MRPFNVLRAACLCLLLLGTPAIAENPDIILRAGADYNATLTWTYNGQPINLTGYSYAAQFRSAPTSGVLFANLSTVVTNATAGEMRLSLSRRQTAGLGGKTGVWDLRQTAPGGAVTYQMGGTVKVLPTVTQ